MNSKLKLGAAAAVGGLFGICGAVAGFVIAGLPGEVVGICIALTASALFGVWNGGRR